MAGNFDYLTTHLLHKGRSLIVYCLVLFYWLYACNFCMNTPQLIRAVSIFYLLKNNCYDIETTLVQNLKCCICGFEHARRGSISIQFWCIVGQSGPEALLNFEQTPYTYCSMCCRALMNTWIWSWRMLRRSTSRKTPGSLSVMKWVLCYHFLLFSD